MSYVAGYILAATVLSLLPVSATSQDTEAVMVSPDKFEFAAQAVGSASPPQSLTLSNTGSLPVAMRDIQISGIDFSQSNNCSEKLAAGATCKVEIVFKPAIPGNRLGALQVSWSGARSPRTIPLTGIGQ
jgi:hypothetical protein